MGSPKIAMDYVYGTFLHQEEPRRARLNNLANMESAETAVIQQMAQLYELVLIVREQVLLGQKNRWLPEVEDSLRLRRRDSEPPKS